MMIWPASFLIRFIDHFTELLSEKAFPIDGVCLHNNKRRFPTRHAGLDPASRCVDPFKALDSPSTSLRVVSLSNHGSSPE
jgi:hypothetical protein